MSLRRPPNTIRTPVRLVNRHGLWAVFVLLVCTGCGSQMSESAAAESVLLLENVTVIDGSGAPARAGLSVAVTGERISAVGPAGSVLAISGPGAETIDASGRFLIPGLWDMHVHLGDLDDGARAGPAFIAHGVTGVRDMGSPLDEILTLRDRWRNASPSGPRLVAAGPILQGPLSFELPFIRSVDTQAEARAAVDDLHRAGVDFIKVGDTVPPDAYRALGDRARSHGLPVAGHLAATSRPAAFLGLIDEVGTVEAGKRADLVLLDGDPLADITNTRRIATVVAGGVLLARADLQRLVAGQPVVTPFWLAIGALCAAALLVRKRFSSKVEGEWTR